jgi:hypothetical protein
MLPCSGTVSATSQLLSKLSAVTIVTDTIAHVGDRNGNCRRLCLAHKDLVLFTLSR